MFFKGARQLAFFTVSALGPDGKLNRQSARRTVDWLEEHGCKIEILKADVSSLADVKTAFASMGPVSGVFHLAMVLADVSLQGMSWSQWESVNRVKCTGAWNLHIAAEKHPLDFLTCFSSISTVVGNPGQANYSAANAYLDGLMEWRRGRGLVGTSINVAAVSSVGVAARLGRKFDETISVQELMLLVEEALLSDRRFARAAQLSTQPETAAHLCKKLITGISVEALASKGDLAARPLFRNLAAKHISDSSKGEAAVQLNLAKMLESLTSLDERVELLTTKFVEKAAAVMGLEVNTVEVSSALTAYGLDSIVAIELRKWMKRNTHVDLPLFELLGGKSIKTLVTSIASRIKTTAVNGASASSRENATSASRGNANESRKTKAILSAPGVPILSNGVSKNDASPDEAKSLEWWRAQLSDSPASSLPFAKVSPNDVPKTRTWKTTESRKVPQNLVRRMERVCKQDLVSLGRDADNPSVHRLHHMILAALWAYLFRSTGQQDMVLLVLNEGESEGQEPQDALQAIPLRCRFSPDQTSTFGTIVQRAAAIAEEARSNYTSTSYSSIKATLGVTELGNIAIRQRNSEDASVAREGVETSLGLDIVLDILEGEDTLELSLKYSTDVVIDGDAEQFLDGIFELLVTAVRDHRQSVAELNI